MSQDDIKLYEEFLSGFHFDDKPLLTILLLEQKITSGDSKAKIYQALKKLREEQRKEISK
jgi:hypothetical protein